MMTGIHFLLTYTCSFECDHCFLFCSPSSVGTFTIDQVRQIFDEMDRMKTVKSVYFEGGEPFLYYPLMLEGIRMARGRGYEVGIVSNSYWAHSIEDAELWLEPISKLGVADLSVSDDLYHHEQKDENPAKNAFIAAQKLGMPVASICIEEPSIEYSQKTGQSKGEPVVGGGVMFRGRAVEHLPDDLPRRPWQQLTTCPHEELETPQRVHIDSFGNVHLCQGLSMGNMWQIPLSELVQNYNPHEHPICKHLLRGGPAQLAIEYNIPLQETYVDECHFCYLLRKS